MGSKAGKQNANLPVTDFAKCQTFCYWWCSPASVVVCNTPWRASTVSSH